MVIQVGGWGENSPLNLVIKMSFCKEKLLIPLIKITSHPALIVVEDSRAWKDVSPLCSSSSFFFFFWSFVSLGSHPRHMEVSRLGVELEL